ncbi:hypothetical protein TCE0_015f02914 [Talaromyces pinophilus]|uniref:Carboxypeptidase n=1 Tax=Talaromyces pinophilus TaxID=128442 RepID=A0A6V8H163_TALPI|nr:hypothetical protein TCE0_015f02914 [Talaromyces pinophilus]
MKVLPASALIFLTASANGLVVDGRSKLVERDGRTYHQLVDRSTNATIEIVKNSGICETTPGVNTYSGYFSVGPEMNMFFWFFEARNNSETAPLATWFNGGPGCSSMIGLFEENGPCHFETGAVEPSLNPNSWNEFANMLYIDQPIGTGMSYGIDNVTSTAAAAPYVWSFLQAFYNQFPEYKGRDFGLFTESYGGHYGPGFADYILDQNAAIDAGRVTGEKINLVALGINNGWTDPGDLYKAYIDYAQFNGYRPLITPQYAAEYYAAYAAICKPALDLCPSPVGDDAACIAANAACEGSIYSQITADSDFDVYDVREPSINAGLPGAYSVYLNRPDVLRAIGAKHPFEDCTNTLEPGSIVPYAEFQVTGDMARSYLTQLSNVVKAGVRTLLWAGDADFICNWMGFLVTANRVDYPGQDKFANEILVPYTVNGVPHGTFKTVENLSFLRVFQAGHEVPMYQPETALQVFMQTLKDLPISST